MKKNGQISTIGGEYSKIVEIRQFLKFKERYKEAIIVSSKRCDYSYPFKISENVRKMNNLVANNR